MVNLNIGTAVEMSQLIQSRQLSPLELLESSIGRMQIAEPKINAMAFVDFDDARERAKQAETAIRKGESKGPLHGLVIGMKDNADHKPGWPSTLGGIRALRDYRASTYCDFARLMEEAGAIIIGKTNSPTFGFRGTCDNYLFGPTRNPFDLTKNSGGSSGGSAAAIAAGYFSIAEGTDGGGSIRIPAAWCGVFGFKPSFGCIPCTGRPNAFSRTNPFIHEGPMTRSVADTVLAMQTLSVFEPRDPYSVNCPISLDAVSRLDVRGKRIGYTRDFGIFPVDPQITEVTDRAVRSFEEAGAEVHDLKFHLNRTHDELCEMWCRYASPQMAAKVASLKEEGIDLLKDHKEDLPPEVVEWIMRAGEMKISKFIDDQAVRTEIFDAFEGAFEAFDFIVSPTVPCLPVDNTNDGNTPGPTVINGTSVSSIIPPIPYLVNFTGHPAASLPCGLVGHLPVGLQVVGRRYEDNSVLAACQIFEQLRPWSNIYGACEATLYR